MNEKLIAMNKLYSALGAAIEAIEFGADATVEYVRSDSHAWTPLEFADVEYRVTIKPREVWMIVTWPDGNLYGVYDTRERAECASKSLPGYPIIYFVEAPDDNP